jgi:hypothetical protein
VRARAVRRSLACMLVAVGFATAPSRVLAQGTAGGPAPPAPPPANAAADTSLDAYLSGLRDSTHVFFRGDTLVFDTTATDSLDRLYRQHPELAPRQPRGEFDARRAGSENSPLMRIDEVEGLYTGARLQLNGSGRGPGALAGTAGWSFGLHEARYALGWTRSFGGEDRALAVHLSAYRSTQGLDAAQVEPEPLLAGPRLPAARDELWFRREGWRARALARTRWLAFEASYRDEQAHPLEYPGSFSGLLVNGSPQDRRSLPGTVRALGAAVALGSRGVDGLLRAGFEHAGLGGKFEFDRVRVNAARMFRIGSVGLLALQAEWSSADSGAPAQERFYAGGASALQAYQVGALAGRQMYLGRATLLLGNDVLALAHVPHPRWLPLSLGLFAETGAVPDLPPGAGLSPRKPRGDAWASDVGVGLWYRPGLPDPLSYLKFSASMPVGPHNDHRVHWTLTWGRLLDWF